MTKTRVGAAALLLAGAGLGSLSARAQDATWKANPLTAMYADPSNWVQNVVPLGNATFGATSRTNVGITESATIGAFRIQAGAPAYTYTVYDNSTLTFTGSGVVNQSTNTVTFNNTVEATGARIVFTEASASAESVTADTVFNLTNDTQLVYTGNSAAGPRTTVNLNGANTVLDISGLTASTLRIGALTDGSSGKIVLGSKSLQLGSTSDSTSTFSGVISGAGGSLQKLGSGNYVLTGNNTYTGSTSIFAGTIEVGNGGTSGTLGTGAVSIANIGRLRIDRLDDVTLANTMSGAGEFNKRGNNTLTLTANSNLTGLTSVDGGTLQLGAGGTTGSLGTGSLILAAGARLTIDRSNEATIANTISGDGDVTKLGTNTTILTGDNSYAGTTTIAGGTLQIGNGGTTGALGTGAVSNSGALVFNRSNALTVSADIGGTGTVSQTGSTGTTTLTGTNTYTGETTITAGTLQIGDGGLTGTLGTGAVTNSGTLAFNRLDSLAVSANISGTGAVSQIGPGTTILTGTNTYTGTTTIQAGALQVGDGGTAGTLGTGAVTNNGTLAFNRLDSLVVSNAISGNGALRQSGTGTTILTGANTYTGATTIESGTLQIGNGGSTGTLGTGAVTNNGTLAFNRSGGLAVTANIGGTGTVNQIAGTTTLSGNNTYSGGTTIAGGTLRITADGNLGAAAGGITFSGANGTLQTNASLTTLRDIALDASGRLDVASGTTLTAGGNITGAGGLNKIGTGTLVLAGSNNFGGELGILSGTVSVAGSANIGSSAVRFFNGSTLQATGSFTLANSLVLDTGGGTLQVAAGQTVTASGVISGSNGFSNDLGKTGAGTLILTGANTYTGTTRVDGGTLVVSADANLGNGGQLTFGGGTLRYDAGFASSRAVTLYSAGGLDTNGNDATLTGTINGAGQLIKVGSGTLTLGGTNTYAGGTRLSGGTIAITSDANLGAANGALSIDGGTLRTAGSFASNRTIELLDGGGRFEVTTGTLTLTGNLTEGDGPGSLTKTGTGTLVLAGNTTYAGGTTVSAGTLQGTTSTLLGDITNNATVFFNQSGSGSYTGIMSGSGGLLIEGTGTMTLTGANTYSGGTTVNGSILLLGTTTSVRGDIVNNATVAFNQSGSGTYGGSMSGSGRVSIGGSGGADVTFTGTNSYTGTTIIGAGNKLRIGSGGSTGTLGTGAVTNSGELHFNRSDTLTVAASIAGSGAVFLDEDNGTTIFTGSNSYTGTTRIWGGTLQVGDGATSGTLGTGRVLITDGTLRFNRSDTLVVGNELSGSGNVVQAGSGTTALTFDNLYSGTTTIEAGTLKIGNGGTTGSIGNGTIVNNGALAFDRLNAMVVGNEISGSGNVVQLGAGTTYLTANNSYSGTTTIAAGTLSVGNDTATGTLGAGNIVNNGTLRLFRSDDIAFANQISGTGNLVKAGAATATLTADNSYAGTTTILSGILRVGDGGTTGSLGTGDVVNGSRLEFNRLGALTVAGAISGAGAVVQMGGGTTSLTGSNSYSGATTISAGTLSVGNGGTTGSLGAGNVTNDATLQFNRSNVLTVTSAISGTGNVVQAGAGTTFLTGNNSYTGTTTISAGTLSIGNGGTTGSVGTGNVINNGTLQINRSDELTFANTVSGTGSLVQAGPGTTILTGANTYSGGTVVSAGTLQGTTSSLQGNVLNNAAVTFNQATNGTYAGNMSGTGSLTFAGGGQYSLTGNNTYTGGTSLLAGALIGNSASLQGNILNNGAVTFSQSGTGTYAGNMSGSGSMTLQGGGTLTMTGNNTYTGATTVNASTLIVNGSLASTVSVSNGGILAGNGSTGGFVSNAGIIAPGNSIGTLNINGNFTQNGGTYVVEVNAQGQNDRVNVNGTATINGATVEVLAAPGNYATSTTYTILNATGGVNGTYSGVSSNYAFLAPSLAYDANNVFLTLALQGSTPFSGFGGNTANQRAVGAALDQSYANATGDFATVIGALANLSTAQASPTLNTISGQPYADFGTFNVANNALFMNALGQQMALARGGSGSGQRQALAEACDVAACDGASPFSVWGSVLGGVGSVQGNANSSTFTYNVGGTAAGIDYRVAPNFLVGLGAGYTSGTQWVDSFMGRGWANTVSVAAYGSFTQSAFYLDALAGYAWSNNQLQRQISVPGLQQRTANGSTGANQFLGQVETGYKVGLYAPAQATVTPFARFQASSINQAAFSEWGANSLSLNVAQQTTTSIRTVLGAEFAGAIGLGNTRTLDLGLRLGWMHEYADTARPMTAAFAGAPSANFTVYGASPQRDSAVIGFQAGTDVAAGTALYLRYDGEVGAGSSNHALNAGVRLRW